MTMNLRLALIAAAFVMSASAALAAPKLAGQTIMSFDPGHGTQIEYFDKSGRTFLWYPGNRVVLPGAWKIQGEDICFAYGANTYNPVTGQAGGNWECQDLTLNQSFAVERQAGDVFGLSTSKTPPFVLKPARTSIAKLLKRITPAQ
jgi:hypothetical protein